MLETYDAVLQPNGYVGFRDAKPPVVFQPTEVFVTFRQAATKTKLEPSAARVPNEAPNGALVLERLKKRAFPSHLKRSAAQVQAQIEAERNAWD